MPACSSENCSSETRYRSSSPPNSRSASSSPPLSWPATIPGAFSPLSASPSNNSPIRTIKRSISNISSSSILHLNENHTDQSNLNHGKTIIAEEAHGIFASAPSLDGHFHHHLAEDREQEEDTNASINLGNCPTKGILRRKQQRRSEIVNNDKIEDVEKKLFFPARIAVWYMNIVLRILRRIYDSLSYLIWVPIIWISAWICVFWVLLQLPLNLINWFIRVLYTPAFERARSKRCVLISGGSTLQALHLARNFYKAGARVIVFEIEGLFGLARFSTACSRFYNVPRPGPGTAAEYVNAIKSIVEREKVVYFIPVSCTNNAYYDALAKPHLEIIGCECFVPGAADVTSLEDPLQLFQRCGSLGLPTPNHHVVRSFEDLARLYEIGSLGINERHVMMSAGPAGMAERTKLQLPMCTSVDNTIPRNLRRKLEHHDISERKPWIILGERIVGSGCTRGYQLITCTTVKDSRVVANVSCRLDETRGLIPEERNDVNQWLETFFTRPFATKINGHLSFKLTLEADDEGPGLVPVSCRVGVSLPYLCLTSVHPRLVWRPCRHFSRQNSVNLLVNERYKKTLSATKLSSACRDGLFASIPTSNATRINDRGATDGRFVVPSSPVLNKREVLFVYWDPLPYCAYYHLQFPFRRLAGVLRGRPAQHKPPLAVVQ